LKGVKLFIIALDQVSSNIDRERYWECTERKNAMVRTIEASYDATAVEGTHFDVIGHLEMKILSKSDNSELVKIACQYSTHFRAHSRVDKRVAQRFANAEAKIIIWPYFRQLVSDVSARMHIPPIIIPLSLDLKG
jgi:preprotein translocase subunit SecB